MSSGIEPILAMAWITNRLTSDATLATLCGTTTAGMAHRVYHTIAPHGATEPYIIFNEQSPGVDTQTINGNIIFTRPLYTITVHKTNGSFNDLKDIASRMHALLHQGKGTALTGTIHCVRERPFLLTVPDGDVMYHRLGGQYRLWIDDD